MFNIYVLGSRVISKAQGKWAFREAAETLPDAEAAARQLEEWGYTTKVVSAGQAPAE